MNRAYVAPHLLFRQPAIALRWPEASAIGESESETAKHLAPLRQMRGKHRKIFALITIKKASVGAPDNPTSSNAAEFTNAAVLNKRKAASYLQTSPRYLERMVASGRLRAYRPTGKLWRVRRSDLDAFLESGASIA